MYILSKGTITDSSPAGSSSPDEWCISSSYDSDEACLAMDRCLSGHSSESVKYGGLHTMALNILRMWALSSNVPAGHAWSYKHCNDRCSMFMRVAKGDAKTFSSAWVAASLSMSMPVTVAWGNLWAIISAIEAGAGAYIKDVLPGAGVWRCRHRHACPRAEQGAVGAYFHGTTVLPHGELLEAEIVVRHIRTLQETSLRVQDPPVCLYLWSPHLSVPPLCGIRFAASAIARDFPLFQACFAGVR